MAINTQLKHVTLYNNPQYYSTFPSIVRRPDGELIVAFRRAPERRPYGGYCTHGDPNSYLVLIRSHDDGKTWSKVPELIYAHPMGGSQDPCLTQLADGTLLCTSYLGILQQPQCEAGLINDNTGWKRTPAGGYIMKSTDGGHTWQGPIVPPPVPGSVTIGALGEKIPAYNRGNIMQGKSGRLFWAVARSERSPRPGVTTFTSVHLMISDDQGESWTYRCPIAVDDKVFFNETALYETEAGDIVAMLRTGDPTRTVTNATARSRNQGESFEPWQALPFEGHPHAMARLNDGRVILVYGCRTEPFGIRARVLNADCTDIAEAQEIILRDDGGSRDLGYPWTVVFPDGRVLVVYYFNQKDDNQFADAPGSKQHVATGSSDQQGLTASGHGSRFIAGTWLTA